MNAILVEDDVISRDMLTWMIGKMNRLNQLITFANATEALRFLSEKKVSVDLAILDIQLPDLNGLELARRCRQIRPQMQIMFETTSEDYAMDALRMKAVGYILKPYCKEDIEYALDLALLLQKNQKIKIFARTFGHFDLFVNEKPVCFKSAKAKELLALLVDRQGGVVTSEQIIATLWENRPKDEATLNLASKISSTLRKELKQAGIENIVSFSRGVRNLKTENLECDLYDLLKGSKEAASNYYGEYMSGYEWAENRVYALDRLVENMD